MTKTTTITSTRRSMGNTIPEGDAEVHQRRQEGRTSHEEDLTNPRGKRPVDEKKKKKKKGTGLAVGMLITSSGTRIPVLLNEEEEQLQLRETLQRSTVEKMAPPVPYLENVGPLGLKLQWMALEEAARRKVQMEATQARGEGTSAQAEVPTPRGTLVTGSSAVMSRIAQPSHKIDQGNTTRLLRKQGEGKRKRPPRPKMRRRR